MVLNLRQCLTYLRLASNADVSKRAQNFCLFPPPAPKCWDDDGSHVVDVVVVVSACVSVSACVCMREKGAGTTLDSNIGTSTL